MTPKVNRYYKSSDGSSIRIIGVLIGYKTVFLGTSLNSSGREEEEPKYYNFEGKRVTHKDGVWVLYPLLMDDLIFEYPPTDQIILPKTYWIVPILDEKGFICGVSEGVVYSSKEEFLALDGRREKAIEIQTKADSSIPSEIIQSILLCKKERLM